MTSLLRHLSVKNLNTHYLYYTSSNLVTIGRTSLHCNSITQWRVDKIWRHRLSPFKTTPINYIITLLLCTSIPSCLYWGLGSIISRKCWAENPINFSNTWLPSNTGSSPVPSAMVPFNDHTPPVCLRSPSSFLTVA